MGSGLRDFASRSPASLMAASSCFVFPRALRSATTTTPSMRSRNKLAAGAHAIWAAGAKSHEDVALFAEMAHAEWAG
jgi:hypothetical protein